MSRNLSVIAEKELMDPEKGITKVQRRYSNHCPNTLTAAGRFPGKPNQQNRPNNVLVPKKRW